MLPKNDLAAIPSATNFVTIDCGHDGPFALAVLNALIDRDVFVRKPMAPVWTAASVSASALTKNLIISNNSFRRPWPL